MGTDITNKNSVKRDLERRVCKTHNQSPKVTITNEGFSIETCCEQFENEITQLAGDLLAQNAADNFTDNLFK